MAYGFRYVYGYAVFTRLFIRIYDLLALGGRRTTPILYGHDGLLLICSRRVKLFGMR